MAGSPSKFQIPATRSRSKTIPARSISIKPCNSSNMIHPITCISNDIDIKWRTELYQTKLELKQMELDYMESLDTIHSLHLQIEDDKLLYNIRESILKEKNEILHQRLIEYKDKYQQIEIKHKYIDDDSVEVEIPITILEHDLSNERIESLKQSLNIAEDNILTKDNKIKLLSQELNHLQKLNKAKYDELQYLMHTEMDESQKAMELQIAELTEKCLILQKEKNDLEELLEVHLNRRTHIFRSVRSCTVSLDGSYDPYYRYVASNRSSAHNEEMQTILEEAFEDKRTKIHELTVADRTCSPSQGSPRIMGVRSDTEEDLVDELIQNEDFMNSEAVKQLTNTGCRSEDKICVMNQYLHLTASAVKIKYPQSTIKTHDLVERVRHCSFYQYYDQMQRILEMEICLNSDLVKQRKCLRNNKSIEHLKSIQSVTKYIKRWRDIEETHSITQTGTKTKVKRRKKRSKKVKKDDTNGSNNNIYGGNIYNTMIYKRDDIKNLLKSYNCQDEAQ